MWISSNIRFLIFVVAVLVPVLALSQQIGTSSTPPPNVFGILSQLQQLKLDSKTQSEIDSRKATLNAPIPLDIGTTERIALLAARANAAEELGDMQRRLSDLKALVELSQGTRDEATHLKNFGYVSLMYGDTSTGLAVMKRVIEKYAFTGGREGDVINAHSMLAIHSLYGGNIAQANEHVTKAKALLRVITDRWTGSYAVLIPYFAQTVSNAEGQLQIELGKWTEAEVSLRAAVSQGQEAIRSLDQVAAMYKNAQRTSSIHAQHNINVATLAAHLLRIGRVNESELILLDLLNTNLRQVGRYSIRTAIVLAQLADLMGSRGRGVEGLQLLAVADDILKVIGVANSDRIMYEQARIKINLHIGLREWVAAIDADQAVDRAHVEGQPSVHGSKTLTPGLGVALVKAGKSHEAVQRLRPVLMQRTATMGPNHISVAEYRGAIAMAYFGLGDKESALAEFALAGPVLLDSVASYRTSQPDHVSALVQRMILEAYLDLLADDSSIQGASETAFRIVESLNVGVTQQAMALSAARVASRQSGLGELVRRDQDMQREEITLYGQLLRLAALPASEQLPKIVADMRVRIVAIDKARDEFKTVLEKRFPAYANLVDPKSPSVTQARAALQPNEALISIFSTPRATYAWSIRKNVQPVFVRIDLSARDIESLVAKLRKSVDPGGNVDLAKDLPPIDFGTTYSLFRSLLAPLTSSWKDVDSLLVVVNGALGHLPLGMLTTEPFTPSNETGSRYSNNQPAPWLIKDFAITQIPSVNALVTLRQLPAGVAGRRPFVGFGDPDFSDAQSAEKILQPSLRKVAAAQFAATKSEFPTNSGPSVRKVNWIPYSALSQLPDTRDEILALAKLLRADLQQDVYLGSRASRDVVKRATLNTSKVVAFATHGLLPGEFPGVDQPSLALSNPRNGQNGLLTLDDILELKLDADWVILSACNTAAGEGLGSEAVSGLGRGFFYAGTRALLATHWPVDSETARLLVTGTMSNQIDSPAISRAQALRQSMLTLMKQKSDDGFSYAHPLFWAPYSLIGDGGRIN